MIEFFSGLFIGAIIGVMLIALVSANSKKD